MPADMPTSSGGGTGAGDGHPAAGRLRAPASEDGARDGQLESSTMDRAGVQVTVRSNTPVPNPPEGTTSRNKGAKAPKY